MGIEQVVSQELNKYPIIKRNAKRIYQRVNYFFSDKVKCTGDVTKVSPDDMRHEYFFGYYDKCPEDSTGRYVLCMRVEETLSSTAPSMPAQILIIDTYKDKADIGRIRVVATTYAWNVQQGCMLQWLGPNFDKEIIYNDFRNGEYCSVVLNIFDGTERILVSPIYSVSLDGSCALTLDFSRLQRLRPGYGYSNIPDITENELLPDTTAIWKLDIKNNILLPIMTYKDLACFETREDMVGAEHKVNHLMINPGGTRFMLIHRWIINNHKYSRLVTVDIDGKDIFNLSDDDMVSHCYWKNNQDIIAFLKKKDMGIGYYIMTDQTNLYKRICPNLNKDGHPSYWTDELSIITDTYPDKERKQTLMQLTEDNKCKTLATVFSPFKYDNEVRCDLHPRWSRDGKRVYFDSTFDGKRGLYYVNVHS